VVAFKGVVLEGLEIAFIVVTFGAEANQVGRASAGAVAALVFTGVVAFLIRGWLSRIPREWLRFAVALLLAVFGTFWAAEGARVRWPEAICRFWDSWRGWGRPPSPIWLCFDITQQPPMQVLSSGASMRHIIAFLKFWYYFILTLSVSLWRAARAE
jgi:hypothetical protein